LDKIEGIARVTLDGNDVIRHKLVTRILNAYKKMESSEIDKK
jgi:phosphate starvation-inducible protein PhoH